VAVVFTATGALGRVASPILPADEPQAEAVAETSQAGYMRPPVVLATSPGMYFVNPDPPAQENEATPTPEPTPEATPEPTPEPQPAFIVHTVQPGESVASIAALYGIDQEYILWNNPDLYEDPDLLLVGSKIQVPTVNGLIYNVKLGDTLSDLASFYQIDVQSILAFIPNGLLSADSVIEGMVLVLPGAVAPPPPIPAAVTVVEATNPAPPPAPASAPPPPAPAPVTFSGYIWPFSGSISSYFGEYRGGSSYHMGIDIDGFGRYGAPVVAAASGTVVLVAYLDWGLGTYIVVRHADGSETVYAHLSASYVSQGQVVGQGETIGAIGCTGYCTGAHLHFEVHVGGVAVDPLAYLP
jgi:murein DD-endopeptidase MepM/ murein hydrolase activator NlpD